MVSKIKLKPKGTPPYRDAKGKLHHPDSILMRAMQRYVRFTLKVGGRFWREEKTPLNTPFGYYKGKSYFPGLEPAFEEYMCYKANSYFPGLQKMRGRD